MWQEKNIKELKVNEAYKALIPRPEKEDFDRLVESVNYPHLRNEGLHREMQHKS